MRTISILLSALAITSCAAQPWLASVQVGGPGNDLSVRVGAVDPDGSFYVHGDYARQVGTLPPPTYCIVGTDTLYGTGDAFIAKYTSTGELAWLRNLVSANGIVAVLDMALDSLTNTLYVVGGHSGTVMLDTVQLAGGGASFISKWTTTGHCLWAKNVASYWCELSACTIGPNGSLLIGGQVVNMLGQVEGHYWPEGSFMLAYSPQGDTLWTRYLNTHDWVNNDAHPIQMTHGADGITALLTTYLREDSDTLVIDGLSITGYHGLAYGLLRADPADGHVTWVRTDGASTSPYGGGVPDQMLVLDNGEIVLARTFGDTTIINGDTLLTTAECTSALIRYTSSGVFLSMQEFASTQSSQFIAISEASGGQFLVTGRINGDCTWNGHSLSTSGVSHVLLGRFDSGGTCLGLSSFGQGYGVSIQALPNGFALTGSFGDLLNMGPVSFTTKGWQDAFIAVHDGSVGVSSFHAPEDTGLQIYANPNNGSFRLVLPEAIATAAQLQLRIYDSTGQLVKEQALGREEQRPRMDVFDVGAGLYVVTVSDGQRTYSGTMVVE